MEDTLFAENSTSRIPTLQELNDEEVERLIPAIVYLILVSVVGLVGNSLVCHVYRTKYRLSNCQCFILCLSSIDLFSCVAVIPFEVATITNQYTFEHTWLCKTSRFFNTLTTLSGSTLLVAIAIDRYRKVCKPFGWQLSSKVARCLCALSIFIGLCVAWPAVVIYGKKTVNIQEYNITGIECSTDDSMSDKIYPFINIVVFILFFVSGIGTVAILYCLIGREVQKHINKMEAYGKVHISVPMFSSAVDDKSIAQLDIEVKEQKEMATDNAAELANKQNKEGDKPIDNRENDLSWSDHQDIAINTIIATDERKENGKPDYGGDNSDSEDSGIKADNNTDAAIEPECVYDNNVMETVDYLNGSQRTSGLSDSIKDATPSPALTAASSGDRLFKQNTVNGNRISTFKSRISNALQRMKSVSSGKLDTTASKKAKKQFLKQARARKTAYLMFLITLAFVLSYLPHLLLMLIRQLDKTFVESLSDSGKVAYKFFLRSYFLNCAINPFIYFVCDSRFRAECKALFKKIRKRS